MDLAINRPDFIAQLRYWSWRVILCASPSFLYAFLCDYRATREIAAMLTGVASVIAIFATITAQPHFRTNVAPHRIGRALRLAANLRVAWSILAAAGPIAQIICPKHPSDIFYLFFAPEISSGLIATGLIEAIGSTVGVTFNPDANSFLGTYLTVLLQAGLVSLMMLLLAGIVFPFLKKSPPPSR